MLSLSVVRDVIFKLNNKLVRQDSVRRFPVGGLSRGLDAPSTNSLLDCPKMFLYAQNLAMTREARKPQDDQHIEIEPLWQ